MCVRIHERETDEQNEFVKRTQRNHTQSRWLHFNAYQWWQVCFSSYVSLSVARTLDGLFCLLNSHYKVFFSFDATIRVCRRLRCACKHIIHIETLFVCLSTHVRTRCACVCAVERTRVPCLCVCVCVYDGPFICI